MHTKLILLIFIAKFLLIKKFVSAVEVEFDVVQVPRYYTPLNDDIYIAGSFNNWVPDAFKLTRLSTNLFKIVMDLPIGSYQFKFTRGTWSSTETNLDGSPMGNRNLQITSNAKQTQLIKILNWDDHKGKHTAVGNVNILHSRFLYKQFNTTKRIWIYLPADYYTSVKSYQVLYMHDAQNIFDDLYSFIGEWEVDESLEKLSLLGKETSIVVGLENKNERISELTPYPNPSYGGGSGEKYVDFILNDIKPYIDSNFRTKPQREFTGILGSSLGGLMSYYAGLKNQRIFSKIGVFSPSFWFSDKIYDLVNETNSLKYADTRLYFVCGQQESSSMVTDMMKMINILKLNGYSNVNYTVKADGQHSEWFWKREFTDAFKYLYNI